MLQQLSTWTWKLRAWRFRCRDEQHQTRFLIGHVQPGESVLEIGARDGGCTYWLSLAVGPTGNILAFESDPTLAAKLDRSVKGSATKIVVENIDLGSSMSYLQYAPTDHRTAENGDWESHPIPPVCLATRDKTTMGKTTLHKTKMGRTANSSIDDYFRRKPPQKIDVVLCDHRNSRIDVLRGGQLLFRQQRPRLILAWDASRSPRHSGEMLHYLDCLGYQGYFFSEFGAEDVRRFDPRENSNSQSITHFMFLPAVGLQRTAA